MTTKLICPNCNKIIESDNINIASDLAKCGYCGTITKVSFLMEDSSLETLLKGSAIEVRREMEDTIIIFFPRQGLRISHIPHLIFMVFGFYLISFWTWDASQGSIIFALFFLPFWFALFSILVGVINSVSETQTLTVSKRQLTLEKTRPIRGEIIKYNLSDIQEIKWTYKAGILKPAIISVQE